jgi:hypothetical protein
VTARLPADLLPLLDQQAAKEWRTRSSMVTALLARQLEQPAEEER